MRTFILGEPPFTGSGEGVRIAVIDSGVNAANPHVGAIAGGVGIADDGSFHDDLVDRVGHGTAVVAAIQEKAPAAEIHVVRVFETSLTTRSENLVRAIDWAAEHGMHLANLSLGTANPDRAAILGDAVDRAREAGVLVVSALAHRGARWWPGSAASAVGVIADEGCGRDELRVESGPDTDQATDADQATDTNTDQATDANTDQATDANTDQATDANTDQATDANQATDADQATDANTDPAQLIVRASPLPRPIPGLPPERNVRGISFAVANASGFLARGLGSAADAGAPDASSEGLLRSLRG
jgi:subtilisin family serine protease